MKTKTTKTKDNYLQIEIVWQEVFSKQETLEKIKPKLQELEQDDDDEIMKELKKKKQKSGADRIEKGLLFIECLDKIKEAVNQLEESKEKRETENYLNRVDNQYLRKLIEDYHSGYGKHMAGEKIKDLVDDNKINIEKVINMFFVIFGNDD